MPRRVLLEDDPVQRDAFLSLLTHDGHGVLALDTPERVLAAARGRRRGVALVAPWGPGFDALEDGERAGIVCVARAVPTIPMSTRPWPRRETAAAPGPVALFPKQASLEALRE